MQRIMDWNMGKREREERFQNLMEEHKKILYKICHSYCQNPADRDDLAQEILFQLWRSFASFDERVRFPTWMYRIALNVAISFYRRETVRGQHVMETARVSSIQLAKGARIQRTFKRCTGGS